MIIFESTLTTFEASFIFEAAGTDSSNNWLELKIEPALLNLACLNPWNTMYHALNIYPPFLTCRQISFLNALSFSNTIFFAAGNFFVENVFESSSELTSFSICRNSTFFPFQELISSTFYLQLLCHWIYADLTVVNFTNVVWAHLRQKKIKPKMYAQQSIVQNLSTKYENTRVKCWWNWL